MRLKITVCLEWVVQKTSRFACECAGVWVLWGSFKEGQEKWEGTKQDGAIVTTCTHLNGDTESEHLLKTRQKGLERAQCLTPVVALPEGLGSSPSTHMAAQNCNFSFRGSDTLFQSLPATGTNVIPRYKHRKNTHTHKNIKKATHTLFSFVFFKTVSLCSSSYPETPSVEQAGLELRRSANLGLPTAGIRVMRQHCLVDDFYFQYK